MCDDGNEQIGGGISSQQASEVKSEKGREYGVARCQSVGKAKQEAAEHDAEEVVSGGDPGKQESAEEDLFANSGEQRKQQQVMQSALQQNWSQHIPEQLPHLQQSRDCRQHANGQYRQHRQRGKQSQQEVRAGPAELCGGIDSGEPASHEGHGQQNAFEDTRTDQELLRGHVRF